MNGKDRFIWGGGTVGSERTFGERESQVEEKEKAKWSRKDNVKQDHLLEWSPLESV